MNLATFKANCNKFTCQFEFDAPLLGDFNYGEFLYGSIDGKRIKYYCGLNCKTWKVVDNILSENYNDKNQLEQGTIIQKIIGLIADRDNKEAYFTQDIYCPKCKSQVNINSSITTGLQEYMDLSFNEFERMNQTKQENRILELLKSMV